jgi:hypothetical protein
MARRLQPYSQRGEGDQCPQGKVKRGKAMKSTKVLFVGAAIWSGGGFLTFHGVDALPLWVVWTVGPLCWYLGGALAMVGAVVTLGHFLRAIADRAVDRERKQFAILQFKKLMPGHVAPAGVIHEIPSMGGFVN